jgi:putative PEP-CTERM system histidine kinase
VTIDLISLWSHGLAALLYWVLTASQLRYWHSAPGSRSLAVAFAVTSGWAVAAAALGPQHILPQLLAIGRTFGFLSFMYAILDTADGDERHRGVKVVYFTVSAVLGLQLTITGVLPRFEDAPFVVHALLSTSHMLGVTVAAGCLILVHNIYGQAAPEARAPVRLPMIGLAGMWIYELHMNTVGYLSGGPIEDLQAMQGAILAMLVPAFALGARSNALSKIRLSRAATFQSISVLAILAYLLLMMSATRLLEIIDGQWVRIGQIGIVFAMTLVVLILLPSGRARAWMRVTLTKHLFQHRYDYREEWLRFTRTMSVTGDNEAPIEDRVLKAIADIGEAPAALLVIPDEQYRFTVAANWNWPLLEGRSHAGEPEFARFLEATAHVVEFERLQGKGANGGDDVAVIPDWMTADDNAWAGVPLIHNDRLVGFVLLAHPLVRRPLDWEDLDLFRTAGKQAASYLAEAGTHHALADAQRFDEFNRRFAFIMHDIKNLVSQLSLVARNAERHADNPEFRADMVATLQSSVKKMNELLARLSRGNAPESQPGEATPVHAAVAAVADIKRRVHPVELSAEEDLLALADPERLEQALTHLVQNAIDASPADAPVRITITARDGEIAIEIADQGCGMSAEFIRTRLFQPFASTKDGGFGIGAFEARTLIAGMGGRLEVESHEGRGTRFTIFLPAAEESQAPFAPTERQNERMRA